MMSLTFRHFLEPGLLFNTTHISTNLSVFVNHVNTPILLLNEKQAGDLLFLLLSLMSFQKLLLFLSLIHWDK